MKTSLSPLSPRETQILEGLAAGLRYKQIARDLGLSVSTVRTHLHNVYNALGMDFGDRALAVLMAVSYGWIAPPEPTEWGDQAGAVLSGQDLAVVVEVLRDDRKAQGEAVEAELEKALDDPAHRTAYMAAAQRMVERQKAVARVLRRLERGHPTSNGKVA